MDEIFQRLADYSATFDVDHFTRYEHSGDDAVRQLSTGTHHLQLVEAHVAAIGFTPSGSMVAENIYRLIFQVVFAPFQGSPSRSTALRMTTNFCITAVATYLNG